MQSMDKTISEVHSLLIEFEKNIKRNKQQIVGVPIHTCDGDSMLVESKKKNRKVRLKGKRKCSSRVVARISISVPNQEGRKTRMNYGMAKVLIVYLKIDSRLGRPSILEVEEHSLGDLNEHLLIIKQLYQTLNSKSGLLLMNEENASMNDNKVWKLVVLHQIANVVKVSDLQEEDILRDGQRKYYTKSSDVKDYLGSVFHEDLGEAWRLLLGIKILEIDQGGDWL
ncbi:hypothetical protein Tco_0273515 [Tanacetum coccineum]